MSQSLFDMAFPVTNLWHDFEVPFVGNESVKWKGQLALLIDAKGEAWQAPSMVFDTPWYHCARCDERLSVGANFCAKCGQELDWAHLEWDVDVEAVVSAAVRSKIEGARVERGQDS